MEGRAKENFIRNMRHWTGLWKRKPGDWKKHMCSAGGNVKRDGKILYAPWYMAGFLEQESLKEGLVVPVDLSGLESHMN